MNTPKRSIALTWLTCLALVLPLFGGNLLIDSARAAPRNPAARGDKVAPDLRERKQQSPGEQAAIKVIVQLDGPISGPLNALLNRSGIHVRKHFQNFNVSAVELPVSAVDELAQYDEVSYVSADKEINALGHITSTTGADDVRSQTTSTGSSYTLDGTGIGIAVLDSGMFSGHKAFMNSAGSRVVYSRDFTGEGRTDDPYGHGTHVATAAAGAVTAGTTGIYAGIATNANLINLRVLNSQGTGTMSGLLTALDWVMTNRTTYNIRVVNMSLGMPAISSYKNDPVCLAVRRLVDAGVVVVAAAGNDGKDSAGRKQYGAIHSPGIEPSAITVGATNTLGTDSRSDDVITTYSSRGPTRSYWTDSYGLKHYDNLAKPDLVAPGNKLIFAESAGNQIVTAYPNLHATASNKIYTNYMYLSGTSMATPITAGAAALLVQANPNLTPNMVKMILEYTAQQLPNYNMFEQGAGQLNIEGAVRLAKAIRTDLNSSTALGAPLLSTATPSTQSTIDGTTFQWAQGIVMDQTYAKGLNLITKYQRVYGLGVLLSDGTTVSNGVMLVTNTTLMSSGVLLGDNIMTSSGVLLGDGSFFCPAGVLLADGVLLSDGVLIGDGVLISDSVLLSNGVLIGDSLHPQSVMVNGDNTAYMR